MKKNSIIMSLFTELPYTEKIQASGTVGSFGINWTAIKDKLIFLSARYCERWACDFLYTVFEIEKELKDATLETGSYLFGFREDGCDHAEFVFSRYSDPAMYNNRYGAAYRAIWRLDVTVDGEDCAMSLYQVDKSISPEKFRDAMHGLLGKKIQLGFEEAVDFLVDQKWACDIWRTITGMIVPASELLDRLSADDEAYLVKAAFADPEGSGLESLFDADMNRAIEHLKQLREKAVKGTTVLFDDPAAVMWGDEKYNLISRSGYEHTGLTFDEANVILKTAQEASRLHVHCHECIYWSEKDKYCKMRHSLRDADASCGFGIRKEDGDDDNCKVGSGAE